MSLAPKYLVVPILVDALRLTERQYVLAPPSFTELPYTGKDKHGNTVDHGNRPFLAETTHAPAFNPPEFPLDPGVHLHFILPRALRTGKTVNGSVQFPPAPDQWIIVRRRTQDNNPGPQSDYTVERVWRMDGAVVWPEPGPDAPPPHEGVLCMAAGDLGRPGPVWLWKLLRDEHGIPRYDVVNGTRPWRHVGQTWDCTAMDWAADAAPDIGGSRLENEGLGALTAAGWGDPSFAGFYPGCVGQFGHFDDGMDGGTTPVDLDNGVEYVVVGWHKDQANDPLTRIQTEIANFKTNNSGNAANLNKAIENLLGRNLGWEIELTEGGDTPSATIYIGRVSGSNFLRHAGERPLLDFDVAIGATGTQAMAALMASEMKKSWPIGTVVPTFRGIERQLDAVVFEKHLARRTVDIGVTLDDLAAQRAFRATGGGLRWIIRGKAPANASPASALPPSPSPRPDDSIELPEKLADDLERLNEAQERFEKKHRHLTAQREQLYTDWYRATAATYPTARFALDWLLDLETSDHPMVTDDIWRLIRQVRLPAMMKSMDELKQAGTAVEEAKARVSGELDKHNRCYSGSLPGDPKAWVIDPSVAGATSPVSFKLWRFEKATGILSLGDDASGLNVGKSFTIEMKVTIPDTQLWKTSAPGFELLTFIPSNNVVIRGQGLRPMLDWSGEWCDLHLAEDSCLNRGVEHTLVLSVAEGTCRVFCDGNKIAVMSPFFSDDGGYVITKVGDYFNVTDPRDRCKFRHIRIWNQALFPGDIASLEADDPSLLLSIPLNEDKQQPPQWELAPAPEAPFFAPADVAVTLVPRTATNAYRMRWRGDGLVHNDSGWLKTQTTDKLPANEDVFKTLLGLGLALDPTISGDETPPLRMDWRAQFAARVADPQGSYFTDWITNLPSTYEEAVEHTGTAVLTEQARPPLESALLSCLRPRLAEKVLLVRTGTEVLASQELTVPIQKTEARISWLQHLGIDETQPVDDQVHKLEGLLGEMGPDPQDSDLQISNNERLRRWFDDWTRVNACTLAGEDQLAWNPQPPRGGTAPPQLAQFPHGGPITEAISRWLQSGKANMEPWLWHFWNYYPATKPWSSSTTLCGALLQTAESVDLFSSTRPNDADADIHASVWGRPFIYGIPDGGAIAAAVVNKANTLVESDLAQCLSFSDAAAAAILEQRPFARLGDLARLPVVDGTVISALLRKVEDVDMANKQLLPKPPPEEPDDVSVLIDPIVTVLMAWEELQKRPGAMVLTLDGFNESLLQLDPSPQLPIADPMGFPDHQEFTDNFIHPAVGNARRFAPRPDFSFAPLRAGALALTGLRLVDSFGFARNLPSTAFAKETLVVPHGWKQYLHTDFSAELPPQLLQRSRLRFRWLDGEDPLRRWTHHPGRSPLCGWLVANTFNEQLDFHDPDGQLLGSLGSDFNWHVAPGRKGPAMPTAIIQPGLRNLAVALAALASAEDPIVDLQQGLQGLLGNIDFALEDIHPDTNQDDKALALLLSRPVAVVQATLSLELERPPCIRQDALGVNLELDEMNLRLSSGDSLDGMTQYLGMDPRYRRLFDQVEVPVTIGAQRRLSDGVVAWCEVWSDGTLGPLNFPHNHPEPISVQIDPYAPPKKLLLLVDPAAQIHHQAGIGCTYSTAFLPPLTVNLPAHVLDRATRTRELCTYTGPHLTPRTDLHAPLLKESGWDVSMLIREPGKWLELSALPLIDREALEAKLDAPTGVWNRLVTEGILIPAPSEPTLAYLAPLPTPPQGAPHVGLEDRLSTYPNPAQLVTALRNCGRSFSPPLTTLTQAPLELREGYLTVRRSKL